jgi:hypothetical protein
MFSKCSLWFFFSVAVLTVLSAQRPVALADARRTREVQRRQRAIAFQCVGERSHIIPCQFFCTHSRLKSAQKDVLAAYTVESESGTHFGFSREMEDFGEIGRIRAQFAQHYLALVSRRPFGELPAPELYVDGR